MMSIRSIARGSLIPQGQEKFPSMTSLNSVTFFEFSYFNLALILTSEKERATFQDVQHETETRNDAYK